MRTINLSKWRRSNPNTSGPRGRGGWLYLVVWRDHINELEEVRCFPGTYTESRRAALKYANKVAAYEIYLMP